MVRTMGSGGGNLVFFGVWDGRYPGKALCGARCVLGGRGQVSLCPGREVRAGGSREGSGLRSELCESDVFTPPGERWPWGGEPGAPTRQLPPILHLIVWADAWVYRARNHSQVPAQGL